MNPIPYIKIDIKPELTQIYIDGLPIHQDRVDTSGKLKDGHLVLIEIFEKEKSAWKGYKVKKGPFVKMYEMTMKKKHYV